MVTASGWSELGSGLGHSSPSDWRGLYGAARRQPPDPLLPCEYLANVQCIPIGVAATCCEVRDDMRVGGDGHRDVAPLPSTRRKSDAQARACRVDQGRAIEGRVDMHMGKSGGGRDALRVITWEKKLLTWDLGDKLLGGKPGPGFLKLQPKPQAVGGLLQAEPSTSLGLACYLDISIRTRNPFHPQAANTPHHPRPCHKPSQDSHAEADRPCGVHTTPEARMELHDKREIEGRACVRAAMENSPRRAIESITGEAARDFGLEQDEGRYFLVSGLECSSNGSVEYGLFRREFGEGRKSGSSISVLCARSSEMMMRGMLGLDSGDEKVDDASSQLYLLAVPFSMTMSSTTSAAVLNLDLGLAIGLNWGHGPNGPPWQRQSDVRHGRGRGGKHG
ncbi:hypothetical protein BD779DRAFT_1474493 [Infundibulicybe gibba]|nr:hypothetical protein BD779DRAFT_1474493 [Infundibulicybe gibba]